jgi:hypothetical protein
VIAERRTLASRDDTQECPHCEGTGRIVALRCPESDVCYHHEHTGGLSCSVVCLVALGRTVLENR